MTLLAASVVENPAIVAVAVTVPGVVLGYFGLRRTIRKDRVAAQTVAAASVDAGFRRVIDGLTTMVDNLQEDNKVLRENVAELSRQLVEQKAATERRQEALRADNVRMETMLRRMDVKLENGINGT